MGVHGHHSHFDVGEHLPIASVFWLIVLWYGCSVVGNITSKMILNDLPAPCTVMMGPSVVSAVAVPLISHFCRPRTAAFILTGDPTDTTHAYRWTFTALWSSACFRWKLCVVLGGLSLCSGLFHRVALLSVHVSFAHTIKAIQPLYACLIAYLAFKSLPSRQSLIALLFVVVGIMLSAFEESKAEGSLAGILALQMSVASGSMGSILQKYSFTSLDKAEVFCLTTGTAVVINFFVWLATDLPMFYGKLRSGQPLFDGSFVRLVLLVGVNSATLATQHFVSLSALHKLSPTSHSLVGCMKRVIVIAAAAVFFSNKITTLNATGATIAIIAVTVFEHGKKKVVRPADVGLSSPTIQRPPARWFTRVMVILLPRRSEVVLV